ncbi:MAG TPA: polymer-forming cytoskeletal protein [Nitrospirales bacterium]|jgi:cytoskeletal protein CcmA (bactofilin family)|nr:polymer-forming cytoskeletal protein [Nitrospirales bacterium]
MWKKGEMTEKQDEELEGQSSGAGEDEVIAFVGRGVEFKGVITYNGTVRIDGRLDGEIHTEGVLVVGEDATITAQVTAGTVISHGKITGDIIASGKVRLLAPAVLNGSVKAPLLSIEEGVLFNGSLEMAKKAEQPDASRAPAGGSVTPIRVSSTMKTVG